MVVTSPFIRVDVDRNLGELMDMGFKGFSIGVMHNAESDLTTRPSNGTRNWRAVISIGAMPFALVGSAPGWVQGIEMLLAFFPPRLGTSRPFRSGHRL